jgi:hypothetical protein
MASPEVTEVDFSRTGGFVGAKLTTSLSLSSISVADRDEMLRLLDRTDFFNLPEEINTGAAMPDAFQYVVTVKSSGRQPSSVRFAGTPPERLREPLTDYLTRMAKK